MSSDPVLVLSVIELVEAGATQLEQAKQLE